MRHFDVYLDSGVRVAVPDGTDIDTSEGLAAIKAAAKEHFLRILSEDAFDIMGELSKPQTGE